MNLPYQKMERCAKAEQDVSAAIQHLREYGMSSDANVVNELREAVEALRKSLIQIAENELTEDNGSLRTQADVLLKLEDYSLIFREKIYLEFLKKVNSLTLKGGCYDLPFESSVKEIKSLGDIRVFDYLNHLVVNRKYQRGRISSDLKETLPAEWSSYRIWQEIRKFTDFKISSSHGLEFATFYGHPVTAVNYLR